MKIILSFQQMIFNNSSSQLHLKMNPHTSEYNQFYLKSEIDQLMESELARTLRQSALKSLSICLRSHSSSVRTMFSMLSQTDSFSCCHNDRQHHHTFCAYYTFLSLAESHAVHNIYLRSRNNAESIEMVGCVLIGLFNNFVVS